MYLSATQRWHPLACPVDLGWPCTFLLVSIMGQNEPLPVLDLTLKNSADSVFYPLGVLGITQGVQAPCRREWPCQSSDILATPAEAADMNETLLDVLAPAEYLVQWYETVPWRQHRGLSRDACAHTVSSHHSSLWTSNLKNSNL